MSYFVNRIKYSLPVFPLCFLVNRIDFKPKQKTFKLKILLLQSKALKLELRNGDWNMLYCTSLNKVHVEHNRSANSCKLHKI